MNELIARNGTPYHTHPNHVGGVVVDNGMPLHYHGLITCEDFITNPDVYMGEKLILPTNHYLCAYISVVIF